MKQNINQEQLEELNLFQIKALFNYWWGYGEFCDNLDTDDPMNEKTPSIYVEYKDGFKCALPLMSIGDIIEFLANTCFSLLIHDCPNLDYYYKKTWYAKTSLDSSEQRELCDCLWELAKEYLGK